VIADSSKALFDFRRAERSATRWQASPDAAEVFANYEGDSIRVVLPRAVATAWTESSRVTIEGSRNSGVQILVEKDFQCLHKPSERDPEAYPHPLAAVKKRSAG
jgi:hypothetical protein